VEASTTEARTSQPVTSRWPPGLDAVVVIRANGFAVVDEKDARFEVLASGPKTEAVPAATWCNIGERTLC
jgi:hypothetical protein